MLDTRALYQGLFDNIHFAAPGQTVFTGEQNAFYTSTNDSPRIDAIWVNPSGGGFITWRGEAILQSAPKVTGPWIDLAEAASPYPFARSDAQKFYRLRR
jgi:hypothetical protein